MSPNERMLKPVGNGKGDSNPFSLASLLLEDESEVELDLDTVMRALTRTASNDGCHSSVDTAPSGPDVANEPGPSVQQNALPEISSESVVTHSLPTSSENGGQPAYYSEGKKRLDEEVSPPKDCLVTSGEIEIRKNAGSTLEQSDRESDFLSASSHPEPPVLQTSQNFMVPGAFRMTTSWSADHGEEELPPSPPSLVATCTQATLSTSQGSDYIVEASLVMDTDDDDTASEYRNYMRKEIELVEAKPITDDNGCNTRRVLRLSLVILIVTGSAVGITLGLSRNAGTNDSKDMGNPVNDGFPDNDGPSFVNQTSQPLISSNTPTQAPTLSVAPTASPTAFLTYFRSALPNSTLDALEDEQSPQSLAYQWVTDHPMTGEETILRMTQRFAMAALYFATDGENWDKNQNWLNASAHECTWYFHSDVEYACLEDTDTIVGVGLIDNGLRGTLPPELILLSSLETIMIETNPELSGSLPGNIHKLSSLSGLFLTDNELSGKLPTLSPAMEILFVWQNKFESSVPRSYSKLTNLDVFEARSNHLTGAFNEDIFGNWSVVTWLDIADNQIRGSISTSMGLLTELTSLDLSVNELTGTSPTEIGRLTGLLDLSFGGNSLTGTIPSNLGKLTRLTSLDLYGNAFTGTIPSELGKLKTIDSLYLEANSLTGPLPTEFAALERVESLYIYGNELNGTIPSELGSLPTILLLHLEENLFSGSIPRELGNLSTVTELWLSSNRLIHTIPAELGQLLSVAELYLNDNLLTGGIPSELGDLTSLAVLHLHNNHVNGTVPESLCFLVESQNLDLRIDCDKVSCDCGCSCGNGTTGNR